MPADTECRRVLQAFKWRGRGLALVEVLVVLALVGVLLALVIAWMGPTRAASERAVAMGHLHSHAAAFMMYAHDHQSLWPAITFRDTPNPRGAYFLNYVIWPVAFSRAGYLPSATSASLGPPGYHRAPAVMKEGYTAYWYSCSFLADPSYWNVRSRRGWSQVRPTRADEVTYTTEKALLFDSFHWKIGLVKPAESVPIPLAMADGSVRQVTRGDGPETLHFNEFCPTLHTIDGVRGRDIVEPGTP